MKSKKWITFLLAAVTVFLSACSMRTIDQMYCLPKRPEGYMNLQSAIDSAMSGLEYHAPISGDHQQPVQMADLNGDGKDECLVFAKGGGERPLKILVFTQLEDKYVLADTIEKYGTVFDQVHYVPFSNHAGCDLIFGSQVSNQAIRPVSVYTMTNGKMTQVLNTQYTRFLTTDFDNNGLKELMILRPGDDPTANGIAELYSITDGELTRSQEFSLSESADKIKRIMYNKLADGLAAVYVASDVNGTAIITDVFAQPDGTFTKINRSNESGNSVQTLRNYYVYADDVDQDGVLELPALIPASVPGEAVNDQHLIRWFSIYSDGSVEDKLYTYHNFTGGWYLELPSQIADAITVTQLGNSYEFHLTDENGAMTKLMTLYVFTGQEREELAITENRFALYKNESTVFAGHLEVASAAYSMTKDTMIQAFHLITQDSLSTEI